jgi:hypothetical protein
MSGRRRILSNASMFIKLTKKFDSYRFIKCDREKLFIYERRWILRFKPKYNGNNGVKSTDKTPKEPKNKRMKFSLYIDRDVMRKVSKEAEKQDRSINWIVEKKLSEV